MIMPGQLKSLAELLSTLEQVFITNHPKNAHFNTIISR